MVGSQKFDVDAMLSTGKLKLDRDGVAVTDSSGVVPGDSVYAIELVGVRYDNLDWLQADRLLGKAARAHTRRAEYGYPWDWDRGVWNDRKLARRRSWAD